MNALVEPAVTNWEMVARIGLALLLGGIVGLEREVSGQPAGLRTHIAVALGAALFGLISVHGFDAYVQERADSNYQVDVTRVASQVVVGIGFLGAGAIIKQGMSIRGLTTAASLWVTAAVGLAVGVGSLLAATFTTGAAVASLVGLRAPRRWVRRRLARRRATALIQLRPEADPAPTVRALLDAPDVTVRGLSVRSGVDAVVIEAEVQGAPGTDMAAALAAVYDRADVTDIDIT